MLSPVNAFAMAAGVVVGLIVFFGWMIFSFVLLYATNGGGADTLVTIVLLVAVALPLVLAYLASHVALGVSGIGLRALWVL